MEPEETHVFPIGSMSLEGKPPVRRDTIFRLASMTKPITAVAAMMLIEEGKLKLDEPIDLLAPELADHRVLKRIDGPLDDTVPAKRAITLKDVMTFRLGWGVLFADTYPIARATADLPGFGMPNNVSAVDEDLKLRASHCAPSYITRVSLASKKLIVGGEGTNAGITSRDPGRSATIALSF